MGFGWPIQTDARSVTWEEYKEKAKEKYGGRGWKTATNGLYKRINVGDLCWTRDRFGIYYLGRIESDWRYVDTPEHRRADIVNVRDCRWLQVGEEDAAPGKVVNSLNVGGTLQRVTGEAVREYSKSLFNTLSGEKLYSLETRQQNLFDYLHPDDCEDLVAIYLQNKGYALFPSTAKVSTPRYEYVLKHQETGRKAFVQVKAGRVSLDATSFAALDGDVFLFTTHGERIGSAPNVQFLSPSEIRHFAEANCHMLPDRVRAWINISQATQKQ